MILAQTLNTADRVEHLFFTNRQALTDYTIQHKCVTLHQKRLKLNQHNIKKLLLSLLTQLNNNLGLQTTLAQSVHYLKKHATDSCCQAIYAQLDNDLHHGKSLYQALASIQIPFPKRYLRLIQHGEENNQLNETLAMIIHELESHLDRHQKIKKLLTYPALLLIACYVFIHFVLLTLIPNMLDLYTNIGKAPPHWLQACRYAGTPLALMDSTVASILLLFVLPTFTKTKNKLKRVFSRLPFIYSIVLTKNRLDWLRGFLIEHQAHRRLLPAFQSAISSVSLPILQTALYNACHKIERGCSPSTALQESKLFPPDWILVFEMGENNNRLDALCTQLIQQQDKQWQDRLKTLVGLIEPITLLLMGGVVLFLIITLYAPLLNVYGG